MNTPLPAFAATLVRAWTRLYTWRMPPDRRDERRAEVDSDIWEFQHDAAGGERFMAARHVLLRLLLGAPDDLGWRVEHAAAAGALTQRGIALSGRAVGAVLFICTSWVIHADASRTLPAAPTPRRAAFDQEIKATTMAGTLPRLTAGIMATVGVSMQLAAQSPTASSAPAFETASIKQNKSGDPGLRMTPQPGGLFTATNAPLSLLIRFAYQHSATPRGLAPFEMSGGPSWLGSDRFDIIAKAAGDVPLPQLRQMLRALLADQFKLRVHHEARDLPVYRLMTARSDGRLGPQIRRTTADCAHLPEDSARWGEPGGGPTCGFFGVSPTVDMASGHSNESFRGMTMEGVATELKVFLGRAVIDGTGLAGYFDGDFEFTAEIAIPPPPPGLPSPYAGQTFPSIFWVLPPQLGLKLDPARGSVDVLVVDSAERPTAD